VALQGVLWPEDRDVQALLDTICACAGITLLVAGTEEQFRHLVVALMPPSFALIDCSLGHTAALSRCVSALEWTACAIYCIHPRVDALGPLMQAHPGRLSAIPLAHVGMPLLESLRTLEAVVREQARRTPDAMLSSRRTSPALSHREREILALVIGRCSNAQIATRLDIALPTVKSHIATILRKTGRASRKDLAESYRLALLD
jgi:DNA-binding CsgD family transcriptional regulator